MKWGGALVIRCAHALPNTGVIYIAKPIDIFSGMGGVADWKTKFPKSCSIASAATYRASNSSS